MKRFLFIFLSIFLIGGMISPAFATGADVTVTGVEDYAGNAVTNSYVEVYLGNFLPFSTNDPFANPAATIMDEQAWDFSGGNYGYGINQGDNQTVSVRAWDGASRGAGINNHYGYFQNTTSGPGDNAKAITNSIDAKYRAYAPFPGRVQQISYSRIHDYDTAVDTSGLNAGWAQSLPGTGEDAEVTSVKWKYWTETQGEAGATEITLPNNLIIANPQSTTYYFRVALINSWGQNQYSDPPVSYDVGSISGGVGEVGPLYLSEIYTIKEANDPLWHRLTYWVPYYIKGNYANLGEVFVDINQALDTHLGGSGAFECIEVDYYNEETQDWDYCSKDIDWNTNLERLVYKVSSLPGQAPSWTFDTNPDNPNTALSPPRDFTQGAFVFIGFGKVYPNDPALDGNYREVIATPSAPLQLSTPFEWNP